MKQGKNVTPHPYMLNWLRGKKSSNNPKLKVDKHDDRMMEDGTLNLDHWTLRDDCGMSISEYNNHLRSSDGGL